MHKVLATGWLVVLVVTAEVAAQQPLHIVIQEPDVEALGGWPLDRKWYAVALQNLAQAGARQVVIDIAFPKADVAHPESDEFFFHELKRHPNVSVLAQAGNILEDSVQVLGTYALPLGRTFRPFSEDFELQGPMLLLKSPRPETFLRVFLPPDALEAPLLVDLPETALAPDHTFLEVVQGQVDAAGYDVLISLDYPGVTSYIVPADGRQVFSTSALQLYAARQILSGAYYVRWPAWRLGVVFLISYLSLVFLHRVWSLSGAALFSVAVGLGLMWAFPALHVYVAPGWFGILLLPTGVFLYSVGRRVQRTTAASRHAEVIALPTPGDPEDTAALDALRYKLQFYENLERLAPVEALDLDAETTGFLCHPDSPVVPLLRKAKQVARSNVPVMILGESGTGKEVMAHYLHFHSTRASRSFVAINCASFNENLIESELFGHEMGAFTGAARRKVGRFEQADGGTLFLDEVAETSPVVQVKLLRVLQEGRFERVGGTEPVHASVRIIAATHQDLQAAIARGQFREDLYYRLNGFVLRLPPLRERQVDIDYLFRAFLCDLDPELKVSPSLVDWLKAQPWRGNVRQLRTATERAVLNAHLKKRSFLLPDDFELDDALAMPKGDVLSEKVLAGLRSHQFKHRSLSAVAEELSIHRVTVTEYLRGWVIRFMARYDFDQAQVYEALRGEAKIENEASFQQRIDHYMEAIRQRILEGARRGETDEEIRLGRFKNTHRAFEPDLKRLIQTLRAEQK